MAEPLTDEELERMKEDVWSDRATLLDSYSRLIREVYRLRALLNAGAKVVGVNGVVENRDGSHDTGAQRPW